jgi:hypothetical protein
VLAARPEVDPKRIGITGHSYGSKWAMFGACLWDKYACAVWSDGGIAFDEALGAMKCNYWDPWYLGYEPGGSLKGGGVPGKRRPRTGAYKRLKEGGHELVELIALMAPRPVLVSGSAQVDPPRHWQVLNHIVGLNRFLGYENRVAMTNRRTHGVDGQAGRQMCDFLTYFLGRGKASGGPTLPEPPGK